MKKNIKYFAMLFVIVLVLVCDYFVQSNGYKGPEETINEILTSANYSYLSSNTKEYIKEIYEATGEIVLTEKNKEENTPYLNPDYDTYLSLSDEEKAKVEVVPNTYIIDYVDEENVEDTSYPASYNLVDKKYVTPNNNQGSLGICWAFASVEQAESNLMVTSNKTYSSDEQRFSVRQVDYATSTDGINNYNNENGSRKLAAGGNYYMSSIIMSYGLSLTDYETLDYSTTHKELYEVLNYGNSNYELKSSVILPYIYSNSTAAEKTSYINKIKEAVQKYGGAYVGTGSPTGSCGFKNTDGTYAMVQADNCVGTSGHAMQIVGWDDNYKYSYCQSGSSHTAVNSSGTCSSGTLVTGTGAWILRNSWGDSSLYKYVYMGYSSYGYDIGYATSLASMSERNWDNVYHKNIWKEYSVNVKSNTEVFSKTINTAEKVEQVKFIAQSVGGTYTVSIESGDDVYENIKTVTVDYPGIYTIDLSDKNIVINDSEFNVTIASTNQASLTANGISVFTSNVKTTPELNTENNDGNSIEVNSDGNLEFIVYTDTKNIDSNQKVTYSLTKDNTNYSSYIVSYKNNIVAENNVNATIVLSKNITVGNYKLKVCYGSYCSTSDFIVPKVYELNGSGTTDDPYLIYNEDDLNQIRYNLDAYYLIKNDITLTKDWVPIGTDNEPFRGGLDGGNHTINGLKIEGNSYDAVGLFAYVDVKYSYEIQSPSTTYREKTYIKNLKIKDAQVSNAGPTGILIGLLTYDTNNPPDNAYNIGNPSFTIDSVYFLGGNVTSDSGEAGPIVGVIDIVPRSWNTPSLNINNVYSSAKIAAYYSAGLIGYVYDSYFSGSSIMLNINMTNFQNVGVIDVTTPAAEYKESNEYSAVIGGVYGNAKITLSNYIINSIFNDSDYMYEFSQNHSLSFIGYYDINESSYLTYKLSNGYYASKYSGKTNFTSASEIKDATLYNSWTDFDTYWNLETIDGIARIPVLKGVDYDYTDVPDITIYKYDKVSLLDYIEGANDFQYIDYSIVSNDNVIKTSYSYSEAGYANDFIIEALATGTATIHVINNYDGYERDVKVNVVAKKVANPTITYKFNGKDTKDPYTQQVTASKSFSLTANKFTRPGFTFVGWNTIADGSGISYKDGETISVGIDEDTILYAQWKQKQYTVKYNANGGTGTMYDWTMTPPEDGSIIISSNAYTRTGYTFNGWNTKSDGSGKSYANNASIPFADLTAIEGTTFNLYAQWKIITYSVTYNSNGGTGTMSKQSVNYGTSTSLNKNTFTRTYYNFKCWNTKSDGSGTTYSDGQKVTLTANITLYAQWEKANYTITFNANGGTGTMSNQSIEAGVSTAISKNSFTRSDYKFKSWNTKSDGTGISYTDGQEITLTDNITLYAQWIYCNGAITFNANDGTNITLEQAVTLGENVTLDKNTFARNGYVFKGWNTKSDGTGITYSDCQSIVTDSSLTLYAMWEKVVPYVIKNYPVNESSKYIYKIKVNTQVNSFKNSIVLGTGYGLKIDSVLINNQQVLYTGGKTRIIYGSNTYAEYTNVVMGDVNGDGKISALDYVMIKNHIMGTVGITNSFSKLAADYNNDSKISALDYVGIKNTIMGG